MLIGSLMAGIRTCCHLTMEVRSLPASTHPGVGQSDAWMETLVPLLAALLLSGCLFDIVFSSFWFGSLGKLVVFWFFSGQKRFVLFANPLHPQPVSLNQSASRSPQDSFDIALVQPFRQTGEFIFQCI